MIDKKMNRTQRIIIANICTTIMVKIARDESVLVETL